MNERAPQPKSFFENLKNAPADAARELKKGFEKLITRKGEQGPILTEAAEAQLKKSNEMRATEAARKEADVAQARKAAMEYADLMGAPSSFERSSRLQNPASGSEVVSLERQQLLQEKQMLEQSIQAAEDADAEADMLQRLEQVKQGLRKAA